VIGILDLEGWLQQEAIITIYLFIQVVKVCICWGRQVRSPQAR